MRSGPKGVDVCVCFLFHVNHSTQRARCAARLAKPGRHPIADWRTAAAPGELNSCILILDSLASIYVTQVNRLPCVHLPRVVFQTAAFPCWRHSCHSLSPRRARLLGQYRVRWREGKQGGEGLPVSAGRCSGTVRGHSDLEPFPYRARRSVLPETTV